MTFAKASRINGCEYRKEASGVGWGAYEGGILRASTKVKDEKRAAHLLTEEIYRQNRLKALARDGYRCIRCSSTGPLHIHHRVHRGMGASRRDDRVENLETICHRCHGKEHGG
jgi:5-methylcytosine-specific restriction endonuclease McrA